MHCKKTAGMGVVYCQYVFFPHPLRRRQQGNPEKRIDTAKSSGYKNKFEFSNTHHIFGAVSSTRQSN